VARPRDRKILTWWKDGQSRFLADSIGFIGRFSKSSSSSLSSSFACRTSSKCCWSSTTWNVCSWFRWLKALTWKWIEGILGIKRRQRTSQKRTGYMMSPTTLYHNESQPGTQGHIKFDSHFNYHQELTCWTAWVSPSCPSLSHSTIPLIAASFSLCSSMSSIAFCCRKWFTEWTCASSCFLLRSCSCQITWHTGHADQWVMHTSGTEYGAKGKCLLWSLSCDQNATTFSPAGPHGAAPGDALHGAQCPAPWRTPLCSLVEGP